MTDTLQKLKAISEASTKGPWISCRWNDDALIQEANPSQETLSWNDPSIYIAKMGGWSYSFTKNSTFIAAMNPTTVLALLELVELYEEQRIAGNIIIGDVFYDKEENILQRIKESAGL